ncbi:hypothetical protein HYW53_03815 [Candidatus Giovannonibacteria bacterium]|nr:hypothetical protein [Candidatus Giovannonibacteria bacterium]
MERIFIIFLLGALAYTFSWEFLVAGIIFFVSLESKNIEYIFLALFFDYLLTMPFAFFALITAVLYAANLFFGRYFKENNLPSLSIKLGVGLLMALIVISVYLALAFPFDAREILKNAGSFALKALGLLIPLTLIMSVLSYSDETRSI